MPLTWRNVNAPNFSGANQSMGMANQLLLGALSGGSNTLRRADDRDRDRVNSQAMLQLAGLSDAEGAEAQVQDILAGIAPGRLNASTLQFGANRPDALIRRELAENQVRDSNFAHEGNVQRREQVDAFNTAAPTIGAYRTATWDGDTKEAKRILAENPNLLEGMSGDDILRVAQGNFQAGVDHFNRENAELNLRRGNYGFGRQQRNDGITDQVAQVVSRLSGSLDTGSARKELRRMLAAKEISPEVFNRAIGQVGNLGLVSGASPFLGGGTGVGPAGVFEMGQPQSSVAKTLSAGGVPAPVVAGFLGAFHIEDGYGGAQGDKGSDRTRSDGGRASGIPQWRKSRRDVFAQRNGGLQPHEASPEVQAKHVLWELTTPAGRRAAGLKDSQAEAILAAKTPEEAAGLIDKYYERSDQSRTGERQTAAATAYRALTGREASLTSTQTNAGITTAASQANSPYSESHRAYYDNAGVREEDGAVYNEVVNDPNSRFYEADLDLVEDRVARVKQAARQHKLPDGSPLYLNTRQALGILGANSRTTGGIESTLTDWLRWDDLGNGRDMEFDRVEASLASIAKGEGERSQIREQNIASTAGEVANADNILQVAQRRFQEGVNAGLDRNSPQMAALLRDKLMAEQLFRDVNLRAQRGGDTVSMTGRAAEAPEQRPDIFEPGRFDLGKLISDLGSFEKGQKY